ENFGGDVSGLEHEGLGAVLSGCARHGGALRRRRSVLLVTSRRGGRLRQREQGHHERKREANQHQFFHTGTPFGRNYSRRNALDVRFLRSAPATGDTEDLVFGMKQVCSLGTPWVKHRAKTGDVKQLV